VIKGLDALERQVVVFRGACLSTIDAITEQNWLVNSETLVAGEEKRDDDKTSLEKLAELTAENFRKVLAIRVGRSALSI
jgi:hypothetical protein